MLRRELDFEVVGELDLKERVTGCDMKAGEKRN